MKGLFCANFGSKKLGYGTCSSVWCGSCYVPHKKDRFFINKPQDSSGFELIKTVFKSLFLVARDGNHFICPFQCDECIFYVLKGRKSIKTNPKDDLLLCCLRRANLDALWAREPSTVRANRLQLEQGLKLSELVGLDDL